VLTVFGPYALLVALALWLNRLDATGCKGKGFDVLVDGTPLMLISILYSSFLLMTGRSYFSGLLGVGGALLLFAVNRLKLAQFKEPLVFVDFGLFVQMIRHPRFYFPYIFPLPVVLTVAALTGVMGVLFWVQPSLGAEEVRLSRVLFLAALLPVILVLIRFSGAGKHWVKGLVERRQPTFDPNTDFANFGLTGSLLLHSLAHVHRDGKDGQGGLLPSDRPSPQCVWTESKLAPMVAPKPHVVLVQAESFFDIRRVDETIDSSLFTHFDRLRNESMAGQMKVSAHGAYTMRTEFSVLTGVPNGQLETDAMNPYLTAATRPVWSLAKHYKAQGYRCICVHPYDLKFFRRDKVMPNLGFDELHGEELFLSAKRVGPYVSDDSVADYILSLLEDSSEPLFVFAITIEAHGPWDEERFKMMNQPPEPVDGQDWGGGELVAYLTHLRNTDRMLGKLTDADAYGSDRPRIVAMYGDHVGCVPEDRPVNGNTEYIVWSDTNRQAVSQNIHAETLGGLMTRLSVESQKTD